MTEEKKVSRRKFIYAGAGAVVVAAAAGAYYYSTGPPPVTTPTTMTAAATTAAGAKPPPTTFREMVYWGGPTLAPMQQIIMNEANATIDYDVKDLSFYASYMVSKGLEYDFIWNSSYLQQPLFEAKPSVLQPIPMENIPRWNADNIADIFINPDEFLKGVDYGPQIASAMRKDIWWKDQEQKQFQVVPQNCGLDCMGYNPEFINVKNGHEWDPDVDSYGALLDPQYKGKTAILDLGTSTIPEFANYLAKNNMMPRPDDMCNLKKSEIDKVVDLLIPIKKRGQFKTMWGGYGDAVNLVVAREVWAADVWAGVAFDVRKGNVPFNYLLPKEGGMYWQAGDCMTNSVKPEDRGAAFKAMNARLNGALGGVWASINYQFPAYKSTEALAAMGPEYYDWCYNGKFTYKSLKDMTFLPQDKPARIAAALFLPEKYDWSMTPGTENPQGHKRYTGPMTEYFRTMGVYETWLTEGAYHTEAWTRFKSA